MNWYRFYTALLCFGVFFSIEAYSQKSPLDKVSEEQLKMTIYEKDTSAPAVYLNKHRETYLDYDGDKGWFFINEITERIKILNKEGLDYATKRIRSYKKEGDKERVEDIEGLTYHKEEGNIVKIPLEKDAVYERELSEFWDETAFTMPNVQVGSLVEWSYKTISPFYKIDDLILQEDIPVLNYYAQIRNPGMFFFRRVKKGFFEITPKERIEKRTMHVEQSNGIRRNSSANVSFQELVAEFEKQDTPALKEEPYVDNFRNYRMAIVYELISTEFNEGNKKEYATTWEKVAKSIFKHPDFGPQLENTSYLSDIAESIKQNNTTNEAKMDAALKFVKSKLTWNGEYRALVDNNLRKVFKEGVGNSAEINLILIALLRECGVPVNPVLISTKNHGIPLFPTREGFNFVVAGLKQGEKTVLLDATHKYSAPNVLPLQAYNWNGRMINELGVSQEIDLMETIYPSSITYIKATLDEEGKLAGNFKQRLLSLEALELRQDFKEVGKDKWQEAELKEYKLSAIDAYELEGVEVLDKPVVKSFDFVLDQAVDRVGDKLFLTPLSFLKLTENPFKSDSRQFPVTFDFPFSKDVTLIIQLPQGYEVSSLPEELNIALPDKLGTFFYSISSSKGLLRVITRFKLNKHRIPVEYYGSLKEFFKLRVDKENEKVVLEKV